MSVLSIGIARDELLYSKKAGKAINLSKVCDNVFLYADGTISCHLGNDCVVLNGSRDGKYVIIQHTKDGSVFHGYHDSLADAIIAAVAIDIPK